MNTQRGGKMQLHAEDSQASFPSFVGQGVTHLPGRVASHQPLIRRWNAGTSIGGPRTQHTPQHLEHPPLNPAALSDRLTLHSSCRGLMGPSHCVMQLALLATDEARHATGMAQIQRNSVTLLHNLKRRHYAETLLREAQSDSAEWEKRYWLNELLRRRAEAAEARLGVSAREHAATVGGGAVAAGSGPAQPSAAAAHWPGGGASLASLASAHSFIAARRPLQPSTASVHSLTSRTTHLPPERMPRRPGLSQSQRGAIKVSSRTIHWEPVMQNGENPPQPLPHCPPLRTALLPPTSARAGGTVAVLNASALAVLGLGGE